MTPLKKVRKFMKKRFGDKSSRFCQTVMQITARFSAVALYMAGLFLNKDFFAVGCLLLLARIVFHCFLREWMFLRKQAILSEGAGMRPKHKPEVYQDYLQYTGGTGEMFIFLAALYSKESIFFSLLLFFVQLITTTVVSEIMYKREKALTCERFEKN